MHTHIQFIMTYLSKQIAYPGTSVDPVSEGQLLVLAFPGSGYAFPYAQSQVEAIVYNFLQAEGELFAFQRLNDSTQGLFKAIAEFSDVDVAVAVVSKFNGFTVNVSYYSHFSIGIRDRLTFNATGYSATADFVPAGHTSSGSRISGCL